MYRVQEETPRKPGYVDDPLSPLLSPSDAIAPGVPAILYEMGMGVDNMGNMADFAKNLSNIVLDIRTKVLAWYEIGLKAYKIKLYKAWKGKFSDFNNFCQKAIGKTAGTVNNYIRAARVVSQLIAAGFDRLPPSPAIALEFAPFAPDDLFTAWAEICHKFEDWEITLDKVKEFLATPNKPKEYHTTRIPIDLWQDIKETAAAAGVSVNQFLRNLIPQRPVNDDPPEEPAPEEEDLEVDESQNFVVRYRAKFAPPEDDYNWDSVFNKLPDPVPF